MSFFYKNNKIETLADIQSLKVNDLKEILRSYSESTGGSKADLILKVYAILMREVIPESHTNTVVDEMNTLEKESEFKYDSTLRRISALGWSSDLRKLPELNFFQLYTYLVVSTRKYRHIVLKGTNYKKLKSYQFFFEGNVKRVESKIFDNKIYVKASVIPSMKKTPYKVVVEFSQVYDVLRAACTCPAGLGLQGRGKCNHIGGVLFAVEDFTRKGLQKNPEPLTCTSRLSVWVVPRNQSVAAKPLDKVLIRKIRFGKKNIISSPKLIKFDPRQPDKRDINEESFNKLCSNLQNCLPSSSFFLFHDIKSNCAENSPSLLNEQEDQMDMPFSDDYDIATQRFRHIVDDYVSNMTITDLEIMDTEKLTRGQNKNKLWFEKRKTVLTASNFGNAVKTKVEPSKKLKSILYSKFTTEAVQYGTDSEPKAIKLYLRENEMEQGSAVLKVEETGLLLCKDKPYLGASLDGIVTNTKTNAKWGLEIKSPFSKAGMTVDEACKSKLFFLEKLADGTIRLKRNHNYFVQIQGQLYVSKLKKVILIVYFGEEIPLFKETIVFDSKRWEEEFLPRVDFFFRRAVLPELFTRRVQRGKLLYLHGGWLPYGQYYCSRNGLKLKLQRAI